MSDSRSPDKSPQSSLSEISEAKSRVAPYKHGVEASRGGTGFGNAAENKGLFPEKVPEVMTPSEVSSNWLNRAAGKSKDTIQELVDDMRNKTLAEKAATVLGYALHIGIPLATMGSYGVDTYIVDRQNPSPLGQVMWESFKAGSISMTSMVVGGIIRGEVDARKTRK